MENAGLGVVRAVEEHLKNRRSRSRILIFCGRGNNGGDGFVVARHLYNHGFEVTLYLVGEKEKVKGDALKNMQIAEKSGLDIRNLQKMADLKRIISGDLIVDALLGTGLSGEVTGLMASVIHWINGQNLPVISIDLPSGLHCDGGSFEGACVQATRTVTMAELKIGLVLSPGRELAGDVTVTDIGVPPSIPGSMEIHTQLVELEDVANQLPPRPESAHKTVFGKVFILAGSPGMTGAATLASRACLRMGAGLVVLGIPHGLNGLLEEKLTEVMTKPLPQTQEGTLSIKALESIELSLEWADVVAIGPGLSNLPEPSELVREIVKRNDLPTVLDADGLNAFIGYESLLEKRSNLILTPHCGELSRLIGIPIEKISKNRIEIARDCASRFGGIMVLKGAPTVIASPEGNVYVNSTGNSGMATAGSGDVLTGIIVGLLAQGDPLLNAAVHGVYLHGLSGDLAGEIIGKRSLIAGDLVDFLCEAIQRIEKDRE